MDGASDSGPVAGAFGRGTSGWASPRRDLHRQLRQPPGLGGCAMLTECTLKEAINEANTNGVSDTIGFTSGLSGEIELTAASGGFVILNDTPDEAMDVRIVGPGGGGVTIDGNGVARPL